jgi:hypothetical protein
MRRRENLPVSLQLPLADLYHSCVGGGRSVPRLCAAGGAAMGNDGSELWTGFCDGGAAVVRCHRVRRMRGAARLLRRRRRLSTVIEYGGLRWVLSTASGGAASGDPFSSGRRSYKRPASLLQAPGGAATFFRRRCYNGPAALLQTPGDAATLFRRRCYILRRCCDIPSAALLQWPAGAATLYNRHVLLIQAPKRLLQ